MYNIGGGFMNDLSDVEAKRQRDFDDLQHELRGEENGRMRRFLGPEDARTPEGRRKKREQDRRTLERLMQDPEYARLYGMLGDRLGDAEAQADAALVSIQQMLDQLRDDISAMEAAAARTPDGRNVLQFEDGRVVYSDGSEVPPAIAEDIIWPESAPSAEDYFAARRDEQAFLKALQGWTEYRYETLGRLRDRFDDEANPMSKDELEAALREIEAARPSLTAIEPAKAIEMPVDPIPASKMLMPDQLR